jgi:uncharacterized protein YbjT (DUF2867 family)
VRILLIGAGGLIGQAVAASLANQGHAVIGAGRTFPAAGIRPLEWIRLDLRRMLAEDAWLPHLKGIDAVINCAGVLQDNHRDSTAAVHADAPRALFKACERACVGRVIHLSAIGVDRETPTAFSRSKLRGEASLKATSLEWVILRPSVVVGSGAYGGSALFRGLAALPLMPRMRQAGQLQIVQLEDLVKTIAFFLEPTAPTRVALDVAGPERLTFDEVVTAYRAWLGWRPAVRIAVPQWLLSALFRVGDFVGALGWRAPIRTTAQREIERGAFGDPGPWISVAGIKPTRLMTALAAEPATVQEKRFARLYLLRPLAFAVFSLFWILTAFMALGPGWAIGIGLMEEGGVIGIPAKLTVVAGAVADLCIGLGIAWRRTTRPALWSAFALSLVYVVIGTFLVPRLWLDPLGPMLKIWPVLALNLLLLAILEER